MPMKRWRVRATTKRDVPMTSTRFALVEFHGQNLLSFHDDGVSHVAIKPIVDTFGIDWPTQLRKIKTDPVLSKGMGIRPIPSERGAQETTTLPIDLLQGWLFKLNPDRVKPEARDIVISYQRECYQVLHDYWAKGAAINPRMAVAATALPTGDILRLIASIKGEDNPEIRAMLHALLVQQGERINLAVPALEAFGQPAQSEIQNAEAFFAALLELRAQGRSFEHHRDPTLVALSLPQIGQMFNEASIAAPSGRVLWRTLPTHPAFIEKGNVNCRDDHVRHCWTFERAKLAGF